MSQLLNKQYYSLPPLEDNHDQPKLIPFFPSYETSSSQYDHFPYQTAKTVTYSDEDHDDHQHDDHHQYYPSEESNESTVLRITTVMKNEKDDQNTKMYSGSTNSCLGTAKWMSSKMRLMRKMMNSYPHQKILQPTAKSITSSSISNSTNSSNVCVRACSDCNTTKTPLWRSGPQGPKSLCNACGIRQRKARKAMSAAAEKASNDDTCKIKKVSVGACNAVIPYKKRYKLEQTRRKIQLEDFSSISLKKKKTSFHPQDEKEAAILLMALSCDLIYG